MALGAQVTELSQTCGLLRNELLELRERVAELAGAGAGFASALEEVRGTHRELAELVRQKADADAVATRAFVEARVQHLVTKSDIAMLPTQQEVKRQMASYRRVDELALVMEQQADTNVIVTKPFIEQKLQKLASKADFANVPTRAELAELLEQKADVGAVVAQSFVEERLQALAEQVEGLKSDSCGRSPCAAGGTGDEPSEVKKVKVIVAAAGKRFEKQLAQLQQQVDQLRGDPASAETRWPGRKLPRVDEDLPTATTGGTGSDAGSDYGCLSDFGGSIASDATAGAVAMERAELKKVQAIVAAAGTAFSRQLQELRRGFKDFQEEHRRDFAELKSQQAAAKRNSH